MIGRAVAGDVAAQSGLSNLTAKITGPSDSKWAQSDKEMAKERFAPGSASGREEDRMRRGVSCHLSKLRLTLLLAMNRAVWLASLMATAIGAYVVAPAALASGQPDAMGGMPIDERAAVGALFTSSNGRLGSHFCTAAVVSRPAGNLVITAAHCLQGRSLGPAGSIAFAPGYHNGRFPHGVWMVTTEYVDAAWSKDQNADDDVAFLVVGGTGTHIQRHTGAETLKIG